MVSAVGAAACGVAVPGAQAACRRAGRVRPSCTTPAVHPTATTAATRSQVRFGQPLALAALLFRRQRRAEGGVRDLRPRTLVRFKDDRCSDPESKAAPAPAPAAEAVGATAAAAAAASEVRDSATDGAGGPAPSSDGRSSRRFPPPTHVPTEWWHLVHHLAVAGIVIGVAAFAPSELPSLLMVIFMYIYADVYSAVLHAFLDKEECLDLPVLGNTALGFQMHHEHPVETTKGVGLYRLMCDTVKIQWITGACGLLFSSRSALAFRVIILKWLCCAYGTQLGHYYGHMGANERPALVEMLQRMHLLLPTKHHATHHRPPYNENFGIVNGLSNAVLTPILQCMSFQALLFTWVCLTAFDVALIEALFSTPILAPFASAAGTS